MGPVSAAPASWIAPWTIGWRKLAAFREVAQRPAEASLPAAMILEQLNSVQARLAGSAQASLGEKTRALWSMERRGCVLGRRAEPAARLSDPRLTDALSPIVHVGMGVAAVERGGFDPERTAGAIEARGRPRDRLFAYESLGAMLGVYERVLPRWYVGLPPLTRPEPRAWLACFDPEQRRLIAHGYGRLLYFNASSVAAAVTRAARSRSLDAATVVQGVGFAHAMVNHASLPRVLATRLPRSDLQEALETGLTYALVFWDWLFPGTIEAGEVPAHRLVARARAEVERARAQGRLPAFRLAADER